jgi:hypothetical protein
MLNGGIGGIAPKIVDFAFKFLYMFALPGSPKTNPTTIPPILSYLLCDG